MRTKQALHHLYKIPQWKEAMHSFRFNREGAFKTMAVAESMASWVIEDYRKLVHVAYANGEKAQGDQMAKKLKKIESSFKSLILCLHEFESATRD